MSNSEGLTAKYKVERLDDRTGKHTECRYFVLDPNHDQRAVVALAYYAGLAAGEGNDTLAVDILTWLESIPAVAEGKAS